MSRQSIIQVLLIAGVLAVAWRLLAGSGQRTQALRRLGLVLLLGLVVYSIIDPSKTWTSLARALGVGRGADLILYGLAVAFFGFVVTTYKRFRAMETRYTRLARRIALDESEPAVIHRSRADTGSPAAPEARTESGSIGDAAAPVEERPAGDTPQQHEVSDAD
jgi:hypothetical protein